MRYPITFIAALSLPATAAAHVGGHAGMGVAGTILHFLSQHGLLLTTGMLVTALLWRIRPWCMSRVQPHRPEHREEA